jgi:hypothetical protein
MATFVIRNGKLVNKQKALPKGVKSVHVISDEMPETRHMADGNYYTSKKKFREATRASGCIEVGNETKTLLKPRKVIQLSRQDRRDAIRQSIQMLMGKS